MYLLTLTSIVLCVASATCYAFGAANSSNCDDCPNFGTYFTCDPVTCDWLLYNGFWAGTVNITDRGAEMVVAGCPVGFCIYNYSDEFVRIPSSEKQRINSFLCNATHRTGTACGECQSGYAPAINTDVSYCVPCNSQSSRTNWLFYILAVYVPRLLVFLLLVLLNVTLTSGPLNSFIFFAQVISTTVDIWEAGEAPLNIVYDSGTEAFINSFKIPYNWFNLNIFGNFLPPFCLHESAVDTLGVIALRYADALCPLLVVLGVALAAGLRKRLAPSRCCKAALHARMPPCCAFIERRNPLGPSVSRAIATFVLLSYNRMCETTAYLFTLTPLYDTTLQPLDARLFYQGSYLVTDTAYVFRYRLPGSIVIAFLALVPILLLHYPLKWVETLASKAGPLGKWYPSSGVAYLLEEFQGCFKDHKRYFAGLFFALRLLLLFAYTLQTLQQLLVQQILFVVFTVLLVLLKPYKNRVLNYVDVFMFANLALINILTWYTANQIQPDPAPLKTCIVLESILVYLPMVYLVSYLLWRASRSYLRNAVAEWWRKAREDHAQQGTRGQIATEPSSYVDVDNDFLVERGN